MRTLTTTELNASTPDLIDILDLATDSGYKAEAVETTISELASLKAYHFCGKKDCFSTLSKTLGHLKVRCVYHPIQKDPNLNVSNQIGSCDIELEHESQGSLIQEETGLRFDDAPPTDGNWYYFESE